MSMRRSAGKITGIALAAVLAFSVLAGCSSTAATSKTAATEGAERESTLRGTVAIDGSSTVYPITEAVAEEFMKANPGIQVTVGISGTGGGFKKFTMGETDISDASRPIKEEEAKIAAENNVEYIELPIAFDGISVVVNPANDWCDSVTVEELKRLWEPAAEGKIMRWNQVRSDWPDAEIHLYGPGTDSGTFDYFTDKIVGEEDASRADFTPSEDDNVLVQGIEGDEFALGYFGYAYYVENKDRLKVVAIDAGDGPVAPTDETIINGSYTPLSRPVFIYVSTKAAERSEVDAFVYFYIENVPSLASQVGSTALPSNIYELVKKRYESKATGSAYEGGKKGTLEELYK
ncbi:MAG: PstS family phosphate ABC transporter substrate-binding protein [Actinobacteria bacterium]|nr:PstS family phosphate ABC transporter substrate-binding protein [Actinomycetota bacterium]